MVPVHVSVETTDKFPQTFRKLRWERNKSLSRSNFTFSQTLFFSVFSSVGLPIYRGRYVSIRKKRGKITTLFTPRLFKTLSRFSVVVSLPNISFLNLVAAGPRSGPRKGDAATEDPAPEESLGRRERPLLARTRLTLYKGPGISHRWTK